jgi:hypothetical protein
MMFGSLFLSSWKIPNLAGKHIASFVKCSSLSLRHRRRDGLGCPASLGGDSDHHAISLSDLRLDGDSRVTDGII